LIINNINYTKLNFL